METLARYLFHWTPERAIWLGGHTLSWDARCAGMYAGFGCALLFQLCFHRHPKTVPPRPVMAAAVLFLLPLFADVASIHYGMRIPLNGIKHLTGVWFGCAGGCLLYPAVAHLTISRNQSAPLSMPSLAMLTAAATALSTLTRWDQPASYYLLESLSWIGFIGLLLLIAKGIVVGWKKPHQ